MKDTYDGKIIGTPGVSKIKRFVVGDRVRTTQEHNTILRGVGFKRGVVTQIQTCKNANDVITIQTDTECIESIDESWLEFDTHYSCCCCEKRMYRCCRCCRC